MKNVFKKTVALVSAMSLMAAGSVLSVSASEDLIELEVQVKGLENTTPDGKANTYTVKPGDTVEAQLVFNDSVGKQYDTICLRNSFEGLEFVEFQPDDKLCMTGDGYVQYLQSYAMPHKIKADEVIITYTLTVPENAKNGDQYTIGWSALEDYSFQLVDTTVDDTAIIPYSMMDAILVVEAEAVVTTVSETTVSETTVSETTVSETTVSETTVSETTVSDTTVSETTVSDTTVTTTVSGTTTSGTTTSVSKEGSSPATGSSSNGVAALAVTMVAAAGAAIALKKKN